MFSLLSGSGHATITATGYSSATTVASPLVCLEVCLGGGVVSGVALWVAVLVVSRYVLV